MPALNLNSNLNEQQRNSITNLLGSGRVMNQTDAQNLAYATGQSANWQQFLNQSASNYSIGNLAQFAPPANNNVNPQNGSGTTIPNQGQSTMGSFFNNQVVTGMSQFEQSIMNYTQQQESLRQQRETQAQSQYDQAFAGLEGAYNQESGEVLMRRLMAEQGIQDKQNQLVEFQKQLAALQNQFTTANNAIGNQPINTAIIRGQQYLKQQEFAAKATLIQAQGAIVEGQLNFAQDLVKGYYEAASTDRMNQINRYQNLLSLADQKLVRLDAEEKDNLNLMISTLERAETRQTENRDKISALLLDPVAAAAWTKTPGLSLDMDYNTLVQTLLPQIVAENTRIENMKNVRTGGGSGAGGGGGTAPQSELDKTVQEYAYQAISLEKYGTQAEKDAAFANVVNSLVADSGGAMSYNTASIALIQMMQQLKGETVNYSGQSESQASSGGSDFATTQTGGGGYLGFPDTYSPFDIYKAYGQQLPETVFKTIPNMIGTGFSNTYNWLTSSPNKKKKKK